MKIVHINLFDHQGGAARIADDIILASRAAGHEVYSFVHRKSDHDDRTVAIPFLGGGYRELLEKQGQKGLFDLYSGALLPMFSHPFFLEADLVHLHCINAGYFSYLLLPFLAGKPLVWTFHDPLAITAGCLHPHRCDHWREGYCFECPMDKNIPEERKPKRVAMQHLKKAIIDTTSFVAVAPSRWMEELLRDGIFGKQNIEMIYNGIHTDIYQPQDKMMVRKRLGLPLNKKIILFAAHGGLNSGMKGGQFLLSALRQAQKHHKDWVLVEIGTTDRSIVDGFPMQVISVPYIEQVEVMAEYYAAADVFVSTSASESFGLTICEAMSCGTPVVSFAVGGTSEVVEHGKTGLLVPFGKVEELKRALEIVLEKDKMALMVSRRARKRVETLFDARKMAEEYLRLYERLNLGTIK